MRESLVFDKSRVFALRIIKLYNYLKSERAEYVLSKQMLRSGTSIGANIAEAEYAITKKDFLSKIYISLKEAAETKYWLDLLHDADLLSDKEHKSIIADCEELLKLLTSIAKTTTENLKASDTHNS